MFFAWTEPLYNMLLYIGRRRLTEEVIKLTTNVRLLTVFDVSDKIWIYYQVYHDNHDFTRQELSWGQNPVDVPS